MIGALVSLVVGQWNVEPQISLGESIAAAKAFCRVVGVENKAKFAEARLNRTGWSGTYNGVELYEVHFRSTGQKPTVFVLVDAVSGDIVYAYDHELRLAQGKGNLDLSKTWLRKLGRDKEFKSFGGDERFDAVVSGYPFWNLNGRTILRIRSTNGRFVSYEGAGKLPSLPSGKAKISAKSALNNMKAIQKADFRDYPFKLESKAMLGCLYDEKQSKSRWAWKVQLMANDRGRLMQLQTKFFDGMTGKEFSRDEVQSSVYSYHSRPARQGLKLVENLKPEIPLLDIARKRLREYGRTDLKVTEVEFNQGIRLKFGSSDLLELGPTGSTLYFRAHSDRSTLPRTVLLGKGKEFILKEMPSLPEGKFSLGETGAGGGNTIEYRQWALGYPYAGPLLEVAIGADGVSRVQRFGLLKRPVGIPSGLLLKSQIEQVVRRITEPRLPKNTSKNRYFMNVQPMRLAWLASNPGDTPRLAWEVSVMQVVEIKNWSTRGSGSRYWFDAVTGKSIGRAP